MKVFVLCSLLVLVGCDARLVSGKIVCEVETKTAYYLKSNIGDMVSVNRVETADSLCRE